MRDLVDAHGRAWRVYERTSSALSSSSGRRSLIFDTEGMVRRVWRYPLAWKGLSDDALLGLMDDPGSLRGAVA